jgi:23S rRNA pseudouridine1911/1915/1917 synthase
MHIPAEGWRIAVEAAQAGRRLDRLTAELLPDCSRAYATRLIRSGDVRINGHPCKPAYRVNAGDILTAAKPVPEPVRYGPEPIPLDIIYEDSALIVLNKPAGLVVHPAPGHPRGTLVNGLLHHCPELMAREDAHRPGIVHRLDKDTSGIMVVAKNRAAHEALSRQFKQRTVTKRYLAIVRGCPPAAAGRITHPIGRHPTARKQMSTVTRKARPAETHWQCQEQFAAAALLALDLKTGRTHQIRVHCAAMHHPIIGDPVYGGRRKITAGARGPARPSPPSAAPRQMLHAWRLAFDHPVDGRRLEFEAPLPQDMQTLLRRLRETADGAVSSGAAPWGGDCGAIQSG